MSSHTHTRVALTAAILAAHGCAHGPAALVELRVYYDDAWGLTAIEIDLPDRRVLQVDAAPIVEIPVSAGWQEGAHTLSVRGLRADDAIAEGSVVVRPRPGTRVFAEVMLVRGACGEECVEGDARCRTDGVDGVLRCERGGDGCAGWREAETCSGETPYCSGGTCAPGCEDECDEGEAGCDGAGTWTCGQHDADECLDRSAVTRCAEGETCSEGVCVRTCLDECPVPGARSCEGDEVIACVTVGGCNAWRTDTSCAAEGRRCEEGVCVGPSCTHECERAMCDGPGAFVACEDVDGDGCRDRREETRCTAGPCEIARCTPHGCEVDPCPDCPGCGECAGVVCDSPPPPSCADGFTRRSYAATGTCSGGSCSFSHTDVRCPTSEECRDGACVPTSTCRWAAWSAPVAVDAAILAHDHSAVAVDSARGVHVALHEWTNGNLRYAYRARGGMFAPSTLVEPGSGARWVTGLWPSIGVIGSGAGAEVHIGYQRRSLDDPRQSELRYARGAPGRWSLRTLATDTTLVGTSLAIDALSSVHVAHHVTSVDPAARGFHHVVIPPSGMTSSTRVDGPAAVYGAGPALAVDGDRGVHMAYLCYPCPLPSPPFEMRYAFRSPSGTWRPPARIDTDDAVHGHTSVGLDPDGGIHVSYYVHNTGALRHAYRAPSASAWVITTVDDAGPLGSGAGKYTSLAIDPAGGVHITYYYDTDDDLRYAYRPRGGSWVTETLHAAGSVGSHTSMAIDSDCGVHVTYYDATASRVRYIHRPPAP